MARTWGQIRFELSKFGPGVDLALIDQWMVAGYHRILDHRKWKGLEVDTVLNTVAVYQAGTIAVTGGSAAVTGTGTTWTAAMTSRKIRVTGRSEWYTFTRTANTTGTLDRAYEGDDAAAAEYKIFQNIYALPSAAKLIELLDNPRLGKPMLSKTQGELSDISAGRIAVGEPQFYAPASESADATPLHQVELYPIPLFAAGYPLQYQQAPADFTGANTSAAPLPWVSDEAIAAFAKAKILSHEKDYAGAQEEEKQGLVFLLQMSQVENERVGPQKIRMADRFVRHRRRRYSRC